MSGRCPCGKLSYPDSVRNYCRAHHEEYQQIQRDEYWLKQISDKQAKENTKLGI